MLQSNAVKWVVSASLLVGLGTVGPVGCSPEPASPAETPDTDVSANPSAQAKVNNLSAESFREALNNCPAAKRYILDVRTAREFAAGHLAGAVLIPVQELGERLDEIPRDKVIFLNCRSGRRSSRAAKMLTDAGFGPINHLKDGIMKWPYETVKGAP